METSGTTGEETTSYWFDLPIDVAEFEEKLGVSAESGDYRIVEKVLPYADEVHEHTSVYQLNELDFMYRQLSSDMQEEYVSLLTVYENLEALYICRNVITVYPDCKSMIDVARQKLMNDPTFKHLSEDCQEYYFDFEAYASHLQEHGKFLVTEQFASIRTEPDVADNAPSNSCSNVVLPEPFNPITATRLLSGVIVNDVGSRPTLPSSYVWPA